MTLMMAVLVFILALSAFLIIVEIFFIPGTTVFGIVGGIGCLVAFYYAFQISNSFGYISIALGVLIFIILFFIGKNMMKDSEMNLKGEITDKVNTYNDGLVNVGDQGVTISVLKPSGKAFIENKKIEVYSMGAYIDKDVAIEIIKIEKNQIFVNPLIK